MNERAELEAEIDELRQQLADNMELANQVIEKRDAEVANLRQQLASANSLINSYREEILRSNATATKPKEQRIRHKTEGAIEMTEKIKPARFRIGSCANIQPQRFATRDPWPAVPFDHELLEPPTAYTRLWQAIVGLCVVWILGFAIWGIFK